MWTCLYHGVEVIDFYDKEIPKMDSNHICLDVFSLHSAPEIDKCYHPEMFLKLCKYFNKKAFRHNIDNLESSSDDYDESDEK